MRTLGIIGGTGPESTIDYYRRIVSAYRGRTQDGSYPHLIINSIDLKKLLDLVGANQLDHLAEYLLDEIKKLASAGADFSLLAANTPHIVFDALTAKSPIPLISIVEETRKVAKDLGLKHVGIFGIRFTMQGRFYRDVFEKEGITVVQPRVGEQDYIHDKYLNELVQGVFIPETRAGLLTIVSRLAKEDRIDGLILAGTELPLILPDAGLGGVTFLILRKFTSIGLSRKCFLNYGHHSLYRH
ncbi:MAG: amino acid racemase [Anaerolineales bacterium]